MVTTKVSFLLRGGEEKTILVDIPGFQVLSELEFLTNACESRDVPIDVAALMTWKMMTRLRRSMAPTPPTDHIKVMYRATLSLPFLWVSGEIGSAHFAFNLKRWWDTYSQYFGAHDESIPF